MTYLDQLFLAEAVGADDAVIPLTWDEEEPPNLEAVGTQFGILNLLDRKQAAVRKHLNRSLNYKFYALIMDEKLSTFRSRRLGIVPGENFIFTPRQGNNDTSTNG